MGASCENEKAGRLTAFASNTFEVPHPVRVISFVVLSVRFHSLQGNCFVAAAQQAS